MKKLEHQRKNVFLGLKYGREEEAEEEKEE